MGANIQQLIDSSTSNGIIHIPAGEFEGPFYIRKPCTVIGTSTTFWAKKGPVLMIESRGVVIKNIRVEITEPPLNPQDSVCLVSNAADTVYENVETTGNVSGIRGEDQNWDIPKVIPLGDFPANTGSSFLIEVVVPVDVTLKSTIKDIYITPVKLVPGRNKITVTTEKLKDGTFLYGELLFESSFIRRAYLSGGAKAAPTGYVPNKLVYQAKNGVTNGNSQYGKLVSASNIIAPMTSDPSVMLLDRGQRMPIRDSLGYKVKLNLSYTDMLHQMDIDPYIFLLDKNGKAVHDEDLIFFGNKASKCGGVTYQEDNDKAILIDLSRVPESIQTIAVCYSIYGDNPNHNFSKVSGLTIRISSEGKEKMRFSPQDLFIERTLVMLEFYRYKGEWKMHMVGAGYKDGLKRLCESYGLTIV